jgi:hypothetical protein
MCRALIFVLLMLPIVANAQRVTTRAISLGTTAIPPLGLFAQAEYEWQISGAVGFTAGAAYSLRTVGLSHVISDFSEREFDAYGRLSAMDLSVGASLHAFRSEHLYPYLNAGLMAFYGFGLAQSYGNNTEIDQLFPMLCLGAGLRLPLKTAGQVGIGGRIEVSPISRNAEANTLVVAVDWVTGL